MEVDYNNPKTWCDSSTQVAPPFDQSAYQNRIDQICGLTPSGKSRFILTWCPEMDNYFKRYCTWDTAGFGQKHHLRATYRYKTLYDPEGNPIDIPPPRWALKQWQSGVQYIQGDEASRWQKMESNFKLEQTENGLVKVPQQVSLREMRPPYPKEGRYIPILIKGLNTIAKHDGFCCAREAKNGNTCYGEYREPDNAWLELLKQSVRIQEEIGGQNPDEPISNKTLMEAAKEAAQLEEEKRLRTQEIIRGNLDETFEKNFELVAGEKIRDVKGFSFPTKFERGLYVPKN